MARRDETVSWLCERLAPLGAIRARAMFGGWGVYCEELFFAIVTRDGVFLKADAQSLPEFQAAGLQPFEYAMKDGTQQSLNYYSLPTAADDDDEVLLAWARKALGAALRARAAKESVGARRAAGAAEKARKGAKPAGAGRGKRTVKTS
ncbi:TfoX/Sxy family protein [Niveibacterium sp. SC-1]|uniref:TfoX/Sxy family protein n=1 Tax=Niveibacterium sp. SC-1 TaxID=3135646 RepID=UPI0031204BEF